MNKVKPSVLFFLVSTLQAIGAAQLEGGDLFGPPPPPSFPPSAEEVAANRIRTECDELVKEDRYAEALATAGALLATQRASYVLESRLLANIALGRLDEARRIFTAEIPPLGSGQHEDRSGAGVPLMRTIQGYLESKSGRCPAELWQFLTEEFYGEPPYTKLRATYQVTEFLAEAVPTDPSPRTLEFLCIFEVAPWLGPKAREALYRRAVELYPTSPVARERIAYELIGDCGRLLEPDGTIANPNGMPVDAPEEQAAWRTYRASLRFEIFDEPKAREVLAHYRIARQHAPADLRYRKKLDDYVWVWERRLGIGQ